MLVAVANRLALWLVSVMYILVYYVSVMVDSVAQ